MVMGRVASFEVCTPPPPPPFRIFYSHNYFGASHVTLTIVSAVPPITYYLFFFLGLCTCCRTPIYTLSSPPSPISTLGGLCCWIFAKPNSPLRIFSWHPLPYIILTGIAKAMLSHCIVSTCSLDHLSDLELLGGMVCPIHCSFPSP